jgi:hypothetical protein
MRRGRTGDVAPDTGSTGSSRRRSSIASIGRCTTVSRSVGRGSASPPRSSRPRRSSSPRTTPANPSPATTPAATLPSPIIVIFMENRSASQVNGNTAMPYLNHFADVGLHFTDYHEGDPVGPSLPDYLQIAAGSSCGRVRPQAQSGDAVPRDLEPAGAVPPACVAVHLVRHGRAAEPQLHLPTQCNDQHGSDSPLWRH